MKRDDENKEQKLEEKGMLENGMVGKAYQSWRPEVIVDAIAALPPRPGFVRKGVIINYKHLPKNLENHEKAGYEIVYTLQGVTDERKFSPNVNVSGNTVPAPVLQRTADGYQMVVMEIEESKLQALQENKAKEDFDNYTRSVKSMSKKGNTFSAHGGENKY